MKTIKIIFIISLTVIFSLVANASQEVVVYAKYSDAEVKLRWLPKNKDLTYVYELYRTQGKSKDKKHIATLKKMKGDEAEKFLPKKYAGIKEFLYPLSNASTDIQKIEVMSKAQQILDFQLIMADRDIRFAQVLGVGYTDKTVKKDKSYRYTLKVFSKDKKEITEKSIVILTDGSTNLDPVDKVVVKSELKGVGIRWEDFSQYGSYNIYRSDSIKGKYVKLTKTSTSISYKVSKSGVVQSPPSFYVDETLTDYKNHYYKVTGIDIFGNESPMSLTEVASKKKPKPTFLPMKKPMIVVSEEKIVISWEKLSNKKLKHFDILRSYKSDGGYEKLNKKPLKKQVFTDTNVLEKISHFYVIYGAYKDGTYVKSDPVMGMPWDDTPPEPPKNIKFKAEAGLVILSWSPVEDKTFLGYKVFRSLDAKSDMWHMISNNIISDTFIVDQLPKSQDKKHYYYKILALDENQNISEPSKIIKVLLPDVTPPRKPIIITQGLSEDYAFIKWRASTSKDTVGYNLYKKIDEKSSKVNKKPFNLLEYKDKKLQAGQNVFYAVTAVDKAGNESEKTKWVSLVFRDNIAPKISKFTLKQKGKKVVLTFKSSDKDLAGFELYRSIDKKDYEKLGYTKDEKSVEDKSVVAKVTYYYYILLYDTSGNTTKSKVLSVKMKK